MLSYDTYDDKRQPIVHSLKGLSWPDTCMGDILLTVLRGNLLSCKAKRLQDGENEGGKIATLSVFGMPDLLNITERRSNLPLLKVREGHAHQVNTTMLITAAREHEDIRKPSMAQATKRSRGIVTIPSATHQIGGV